MLYCETIMIKTLDGVYEGIKINEKPICKVRYTGAIVTGCEKDGLIGNIKNVYMFQKKQLQIFTS